MSGVLRRLFSWGAKEKSKAPQGPVTIRDGRREAQRGAKGPVTSRSGQVALSKENVPPEGELHGGLNP